MMDPTKKDWQQCAECKHLHTTVGLPSCKNTCCQTGMKPVQVRRCSVCWGEGSYMEEIDEEKPLVRVNCTSCSSKGVIPTLGDRVVSVLEHGDRSVVVPPVDDIT